MHPILFNIPILNTPIFSYGVMMVFAFLATQWLSSRLAKRLGYDPEIFVNATLFALVAGVLGSRLSHILENLSDYTRADLSLWQNLANMLNIRSGGLTFYGGLILATPVVLLYLAYRNVPIRAALDIVAPCIVLGLGIGRIGCYLNGCCYGADANVQWAVQFPYGSNAYEDQFYAGTLNHSVPPQLLKVTEHGARLLKPDEFRNDPALVQLAKGEKSNFVHPAQLYSTLTSLLIMALCLSYLTVPHAAGRVFALMLMVEGPSRFMLEMLRTEPAIIGPWSLSMLLGAIFFVVGLGLWIAFGLGKNSATRGLYAAEPIALPAI